MIDLHSHLLPGIDDGAGNLEDSLSMARAAVSDGITVSACTPHIFPGLYDNHGEDIHRRVGQLRQQLEAEGVPLRIVSGADVQISPEMLTGLRSGKIPTLNGSRYFLFEPPHHVAPPRLEHVIFELMTAGYHPILTHPERLTWIESHYATLERLVRAGVWMQLTAGSITGSFGERCKYWSERMLGEGVVHILATDAHNLRSRPPVLSKAYAAVERRVGREAANAMVLVRPQMVLDDVAPDHLTTNSSPADAARLVSPLRRWIRGKREKASEQRR